MYYMSKSCPIRFSVEAILGLSRLLLLRRKAQ